MEIRDDRDMSFAAGIDGRRVMTVDDIGSTDACRAVIRRCIRNVALA
ncbi:MULTISPECIES: hypothetical protein [Methylobacterium]|jgi:hypothetical protein|nr:MULTISPECIES: hypothetical protein [Methylobacterium]